MKSSSLMFRAATAAGVCVAVLFYSGNAVGETFNGDGHQYNFYWEESGMSPHHSSDNADRGGWTWDGIPSLCLKNGQHFDMSALTWQVAGHVEEC